MQFPFKDHNQMLRLEIIPKTFSYHLIDFTMNPVPIKLCFDP